MLRCAESVRQLLAIRRSVFRSVIQTLMTSLFLCRLDYGNALPAGILAGIPQHLLRRLQSVMLGQSARRRGLIISLRLPSTSLAVGRGVISNSTHCSLAQMYKKVYTPPNLANDIIVQLIQLGVCDARHRLSSVLVVRPSKAANNRTRSAIPVAASRVWNFLNNSSTERHPFKCSKQYRLIFFFFFSLISIRFCKVPAICDFSIIDT